MLAPTYIHIYAHTTHTILYVESTCVAFSSQNPYAQYTHTHTQLRNLTLIRIYMVIKELEDEDMEGAVVNRVSVNFSRCPEVDRKAKGMRYPRSHHSGCQSES